VHWTDPTGLVIEGLGDVELGNTDYGIHVVDASAMTIGSPAPVRLNVGSLLSTDPDTLFQNIIRGNQESGIALEGDAFLVTIRGNKIYDNADLGIDLDADAISPNDLGDGLRSSLDTEDGPNGLMNFPVGITAAVDPKDKTMWLISGILDSREPHQDVVDIYNVESPDDTGFGEGRTHLAVAGPDSFGVFLTQFKTASGEIDPDTTNNAINLRSVVASGINREPGPEIPQKFALHGNHPNPFSGVTRVGFDLPRNARVVLEVYNAIGQRVDQVVDNTYAAGTHLYTH
jgi:hypothetical protein